MPIRYEQADDSIHAMAREVMEKHHPELRMPDQSYVKLCILMAEDDDLEDGESTLKDAGYPLQAKVSVIQYKQRVDERDDAEILLDRANWERLTEPQQRALLDHAVTHLDIQKDENGFVKTDDVGRPKLKLKVPDFRLSGFRSVARRHGDDAPEVIAARAFERDYGEDVLGRAELFGGGGGQ